MDLPETGRGDSFAKFFFYALGDGAIGFSPFGVDQSGWNILGDEPWKAHSNNFALIGPMSREIAQLEFDGKLKTSVEEPGQATQELDFGAWQATVAFGFPQSDGRRAPGTKDAHGASPLSRNLGQTSSWSPAGARCERDLPSSRQVALDALGDCIRGTRRLRERRLEAASVVEWR